MKRDKKRGLATKIVVMLIMVCLASIILHGEMLMISKDKACEIARSKLKEAAHLESPNLCELWVGAKLEEGFLVHTREEKPSYWCFPVVKNDKVLGFIRIDYKFGIVRSWGFMGNVVNNPEDLSMWPKQYRISAEDARAKANSLISKYEDVEVRGPIYVIVQGEAWMFVLEKGNKVVTRVFVIDEFVWEEKEKPSPFYMR